MRTYHLHEEPSTHTQSARTRAGFRAIVHCWVGVRMPEEPKLVWTHDVRGWMFRTRLSLILFYFLPSFVCSVDVTVAVGRNNLWFGFESIFRDVFSSIQSTRSIHAANTNTITCTVHAKKDIIMWIMLRSRHSVTPEKNERVLFWGFKRTAIWDQASFAYCGAYKNERNIQGKMPSTPQNTWKMTSREFGIEHLINVAMHLKRRIFSDAQKFSLFSSQYFDSKMKKVSLRLAHSC